MQGVEENQLYINLEDSINDLVDKQHLSKEVAERMYREWAGITKDDTVLFDDKGKIKGFRPFKSMEFLELSIMVNPKTGEVDIV